MTRMLAFVAALLMSALAVSSACVASDPAPLRFTLEQSRGSERLQLSFKRADQGYANSWSTSFRPAELAGLDLAAFRGSQIRPVRFAIAREPGRIDCAGTGGAAMATGACSLTPDPAFNDFLAANGIARPTQEQTYGLIAVNAKRGLVTALKATGYPTPTIGDLISLAAVGVTNEYITGLARAGYRPGSLDSLLQFRALNITPDYVGRFNRAGYGDIPPSDLIQLKALDVTPEFIAGFERIGYRDLPVSTLVQLKAMNVTPEFARAVQQGGPLPSPDRLVQIRALGRGLRK